MLPEVEVIGYTTDKLKSMNLTELGELRTEYTQNGDEDNAKRVDRIIQEKLAAQDGQTTQPGDVHSILENPTFMGTPFS